jgi:hypothetical protein
MRCILVTQQDIGTQLIPADYEHRSQSEGTSMASKADPGQPLTYQIKVQGQLDRDWSDSFSGMAISLQGDHTTLTGLVSDQAALRGMLNRMWDLNLTLISVFAIPDEPVQAMEDS